MGMTKTGITIERDNKSQDVDVRVEWKWDRKTYKEKQKMRVIQRKKIRMEKSWWSTKETKRKEGEEGEPNRKGKEKKICSLTS